MPKLSNDSYVMPRPVERLPDYASAQARRNLAERLSEAFGLSAGATAAIANAVVDPSAVRKSIGDASDPTVERIAVPGGTLLGVRTQVWSRRIMPDPRNPRTLPMRRHPFAVEPGTAGEESKFRPVPEPRSPDPSAPLRGELQVDIESRHQLNWAAQLAARFVLADNDWRDSIRSQGVMEAVWLVATTYATNDEYESATALTTVEGSSRTTAVHDVLDVRSADVPYELNEAGLRGYYRKLNTLLESGPSPDDAVALRCERMPALILLGFEPHPKVTIGFPTAVKSYVALRHVDYPKPWGEGPENESLADEVLDELYRRNLITGTERDYFGGSCTRAEARAARLSDDPAIRAASIVRLLSSQDERISTAIRMAVTSQSTRKRITAKLANELATALILRALDKDRSKTDQVRRYMRHAFGKAVHRELWESTNRDTTTLVEEAMAEVKQAIASGNFDEAGPSTIELAVRGAYALVTEGRLNADRGTANNDQPDRRTPGEVLEQMRQSPQGVLQLGRVLQDFTAGEDMRAVDTDGRVRRTKDSDEVMINDIYLRNAYPAEGAARADRPGETPDDVYHNRLNALSNAVTALEKAFVDLGAVTSDDGRPIVEGRGVDSRTCSAWRKTMAEIDEELVVWSRTFKRTLGVSARPARDEEHDVEIETDENDIVSDWDREVIEEREAA